MIKRSITPFINTRKYKSVLIKMKLMMYLNQSILQLYENIQKGSAWTIDSVINQNIHISNYNFLAASSYIKLLKKLDH